MCVVLATQVHRNMANQCPLSMFIKMAYNPHTCIPLGSFKLFVEYMGVFITAFCPKIY